MHIGILTGGGDCPGLNAVIRAATLAMLGTGARVSGIERGFLGLMRRRVRPLLAADVEDIVDQGGTITPEQPEETTEIAFEVALDRLEKIVADLERGQPELATALSKYETGLRLLNHCHAVLDRAERSVAILTGIDGDGNPQTAPFDASATEKTTR